MSTTEPTGTGKSADETTATTADSPVVDAPVDAQPVYAEPSASPGDASDDVVIVEEERVIDEPAVSEPVDVAARDQAATRVIEEEVVYALPERTDADIADTGSSEPYIPAATLAAPVVVEEVVTEQYPAAPVQPTPIYVQAPTPPVDKGNRGFGILVGLIATAAFAAIYAIVALIIAGVLTGSGAVSAFADFAARPVFYIPILFFFGAFALLSAIINRAGWWSWVLGAFFGAVVVYFSYIGASLLTVRAWEMTPQEAVDFINGRWLDPLAIAAAVIAREVPIWFGAWIAARGRKVSERNLAARQEYDRVLAEGPTISR